MCSVVLVRTTLDESLVVHAWVQRVHVYCVWQRCSVQRFNRPHPFQSPSVQAQLYPLDRGKTLDLKHQSFSYTRVLPDFNLCWTLDAAACVVTWNLSVRICAILTAQNDTFRDILNHTISCDHSMSSKWQWYRYRRAHLFELLCRQLELDVKRDSGQNGTVITWALWPHLSNCMHVITYLSILAAWFTWVIACLVRSTM